jgi:hypothetical protein
MPVPSRARRSLERCGRAGNFAASIVGRCAKGNVEARADLGDRRIGQFFECLFLLQLDRVAT